MKEITKKKCENILLIIPVRNWYSGITIDLGILYLYSALKRDGIKATMLHCPKEGMDLDDFKIFLEHNPQIRIIWFKSYSVDHNSIKRMSKIAKEVIPDCTIIVGGPHPTSIPEYVLKDMIHIDYVSVGEGEIGFPIFCKKILQKDSVDDVPWLWFRINGEIKINPNQIYDNLDDLPEICWEDINIEEYPNFMTSLRFVPVMATRWCPYQCKYCAAHKIVGRRIRYRSVNNVINELKRLKSIGINEINFSDDELTLNRKYFLELCNGIIDNKLDILWECSNGVRLDTLDDEVLDIMYNAGCRYVAVGIESSSNQILKDMKKNITTETIIEKLDLIKRHKVIPQWLFMIGFPNESEQDIKNTIKFSQDLDIDKTNFSIFMPLPGSETFDELIASKEIEIEKINRDDMRPDRIARDRWISAKRLKKLQRMAYLKFYLRPKPMKRFFKEMILDTKKWKTVMIKLKSILFK